MKKALCLVLALVLCLPSFAAFADVEGTVQGDIMLTSTEAEAVSDEKTDKLTFSDIVADSILGEAVYKLVEGKVIAGYPDGTFKPNAGLTRAELSKMINLVFDLNQKAENLSFTDVSEDDWYYDYVLVAVEAGYIKGFTDNTFRGDDPVTREQACAIINRVITAKGMNLFDLPFTDNITDNVSDWAIEDVKKIIANYIMPLEEGGKFRATENITRGELALALESFVVILPEYTVTFDSKGGSKVESIVVKEGSKLTKPTDPTKKGFKFGGWYSDEKLKTAYDFESAVTKDITLYAKWKAEATGGGGGGVYIPPSGETTPTYTVTFKFNNGSENETQTVTSGNKVTKPDDPAKELKIFTGWYTDSACTNLYNFDNSVTSSFTLYAGWEDDIAAINEQKITDVTIFRDALAATEFDPSVPGHQQIADIIVGAFDRVISGGPYEDFIIDEDYIRSTCYDDMLQVKNIWDNELFEIEGNPLYQQQTDFKDKIAVVLTDAQVGGFSMTLSQSYEWFKKIIDGIIDWD